MASYRFAPGLPIFEHPMKHTIVDWAQIDTVMLDMDGTILDLHFDNEFWTQHLPRRYAEHHQLGLDESNKRLAPVFSENAGQLNRYCTDFWADITGLDIIALKHEIAELIGPLPGALEFLQAVQASGRPIWLVTNAHRGSVDLKLQRTGLGHYFEHIVSSHDFGYAKEAPEFWQALVKAFPVQRERALFVDDSPAVVAAAVDYGIGQVVALSHPDSRGGVREHGHNVVGERLVDLLPVG